MNLLFLVMMLKLAGYQEVNQIYAGARTLVYRAIQPTTEQPVIIKVLRNPHPNFQELVRFRNQYIITCHLEHPNIVQPLALERYFNGYALVMPDEGAVSLPEYWQLSEQSLTEFLTIALQLAEALHYLGQQRIIHKDIKPANILINPETGQVQLIDFSISSLLPKEQQQLLNPQGLEGTLAYISPEQTGRMNRGIDYRTDFYSLGVTFYKLLTGILPFHSNEPMELLHRHIAQTPLTLYDFLNAQGESYPPVISKITLKLMAKNAEERYQSALGLRHDLERCLQQLDATGVIETFELGERDICDRFLIPEKLYGRETEVETLLTVFDRVANPPEAPLGKGGHRGTELLLVAGFSGIGKTAVINEVHKPIVEKRGYFIKGKFDQFNRNVPFSAFVQAFRSLMGQLLGESDAALATWKEKILNAVGVSGQVILEVIPELERIIGQQPTVPELSGSAAQNRFNLLFSKFVQVFTTKDHPLVIFLDDLQWVDSASLNLLKLLLSESEAGYLLVLGAYRDNEVFPAHPLMLALDELRQQKAVINTLTLAPLAEVDINHLVADTLLCSAETATPLSKLVYQKTKGNPFFTTQFLLGLHAEGCIVFDSPSLLSKVNHPQYPLSKGGSQRGWQCDLSRVRQLALTDDVVEFMAGRLQKLPETTQEVLKIAASIGNQFDLATLAVVCEQSQENTATDLWQALQEGLVIPENETYKFFQGDSCEIESTGDITVGYRFLHDRVQQAAYFLIDAALKPETHLKIGRLLLNNLSASAIEGAIFNLTNQLNKGYSLIDDRHEKDELARLNLIAGRKAKASTAYLTSIDYLNSGIKLLEDGWSRQYNLTLSLYLEAIESEYISTNFERSKILADLALEQVKSLLDRLKIHELQIQYYIAKNQRKKAVELGLDALKLLNIELDGVSPEVTDIEALADLPEMIDPYKITTLQILITIVSAAVVVAPELLIPIAFKLVNICIHSGNSRLSAYAYGFHAWMLCSSLGEIDAGYRFGKLAIQLLEKFNAKEIKCKVYQQFNVFVRHRKEPLEAMKELVKAVESGMEVGDIEYACYAAQDYCILQFFLGGNLEFSLQEQEKYLKLIRHNQQEFSINFTSPWLQLVSNLLGQSVDRCSLNGSFFDETEKIPVLKHINDSISLFPILFIKTYLNYLFDFHEIAVENAIYAEKLQTGSNGFIYYPVYLFYFSLALLACCLKPAYGEQKDFIDRVNFNQNKLVCWMNDAPFTYQHKYDIVQAEYHRVSGEKLAAIDLYDRAISGAKANEFIQEEALANELAAKFYLEWGKEKIAATYMQEAYFCYAHWGAKAKTDDLEQRYPHLLQSILQRTTQTHNSLESLSFVNPQISVHSSAKASVSASTSINNTLDFAAVIKTSQALSSIIKLDELLRQLTQTILQQSGGDRCALILPNKDSIWFVEAIATTDTTNLCSVPLEDHLDFPIKLIQYVKNSQTVVVLDDLDTDLPIIDDYLNQQQPKSVLCLPILNQSQLIGILYLSNQSTSGVFTSDRILILNFLCTQAAISLTNARLYSDLQANEVRIRESEQRYVTLTEAVPVGIFRTDAEGYCIYVNDRWCQIAGLTPEEAAGDGWQQGLYIEDRDRIATEWYQAAREHRPCQLECRFQSPDGKITWVYAQSVAERDAEGQVIGYVGSITDISDRKAAEVSNIMSG
ncbi:MAG: AAA family ATPase [Symploca sp. SIO2D2]|nr:AAA family ATPase [Symploca sp. SIO2D2]